MSLKTCPQFICDFCCFDLLLRMCFLELYENLDLRPDLGIESYGVSMTTLNEVFLKLEGESTIDEPGNANA